MNETINYSLFMQDDLEELHEQANNLANDSDSFNPLFSQHVSVLKGADVYVAIVNRRKLLTLPKVGTKTLYKFAEHLRGKGWQVYSTI